MNKLLILCKCWVSIHIFISEESWWKEQWLIWRVTHKWEPGTYIVDGQMGRTLLLWTTAWKFQCSLKHWCFNAVWYLESPLSPNCSAYSDFPTSCIYFVPPPHSWCLSLTCSYPPCSPVLPSPPSIAWLLVSLLKLLESFSAYSSAPAALFCPLLSQVCTGTFGPRQFTSFRQYEFIEYLQSTKHCSRCCLFISK